ncbi:hypothetical protein Tco_0098317 [Tanacetum coccineum]
MSSSILPTYRINNLHQLYAYDLNIGGGLADAFRHNRYHHRREKSSSLVRIIISRNDNNLRRQTGLEVDNRNRNENRSHITHKSMARIGIVEDGLQHLENRMEV